MAQAEPIEAVDSRVETVVEPVAETEEEPIVDCFHCGQQIPPFIELTVEIEQISRPVCCHGCKAAAEFIQANGMADFYQYRGQGLPERPLIAKASTQQIEPQWLRFDQSSIQQKYIHNDTEFQNVSIYVQGIYCSSCGWLLDKALSQLSDDVSVQLNTDTHYLRIRWPQQSALQLSQILHVISQLGYQPRPIELTADIDSVQQLRDDENHAALKRLIVAGLGMMQVMMYAVALYLGEDQGIDPQIRQFLNLVSLLVATAVVFYAGRPFFQHAILDVIHRRLGMDIPVALAIAGAYFPSVFIVLLSIDEPVYFDSAVMFIFFLSVGRYLEMRARYQSASSQQALRFLLPATITVERDQSGVGQAEMILIPPQNIQMGDRATLGAGETIPFDGVVQNGSAYCDQSCLNGEATPILRDVGKKVIAGSVISKGQISIVASADWANSSMAAIEQLLSSAQAKESQNLVFMQTIARYFVVFILVLSSVVALYWWQHQPQKVFTIVLAMLIASCPCAFSLAAPAVATSASHYLRRFGVLLANFDALQKLQKVSHWCFDKTGTLTRGNLTISNVEVVKTANQKNLDQTICLQIASALEKGSSHVLASSLTQMDSDLVAQNIRNFDQGVSGEIDGCIYYLGKASWVYQQANVDQHLQSMASDEVNKTLVVLARDKQLIARIYLSDSLRSDVAPVLDYLKRHNKQCSVLSGDRQSVVDYQFSEFALEHAKGDMLAQDKSNFIKQLQAQETDKQNLVAMVGDGVNDAPVLSQADVSIALASGSQLSHSQADIILLGSRLYGIELLHQVAEKSQLIIKQNMAWAIAYNMLALPLAASGILTPWMAAIGMSLSSLLVVLNARRIGSIK